MEVLCIIDNIVIWQHAAGDRAHEHVDVCLNWDVILSGPGKVSWQCSNRNDARKEVRAFCEEMQVGDIVVLKVGITGLSMFSLLEMRGLLTSIICSNTIATQAIWLICCSMSSVVARMSARERGGFNPVRALACLSGRLCDGNCPVCCFGDPQIAAQPCGDGTVSRIAGCCYGYEPDRFSPGFVFGFALTTSYYYYFSRFKSCR